MIQDNAVRQADMTIKQLLCCVPTDTNTVCRIGLLVLCTRVGVLTG